MNLSDCLAWVLWLPSLLCLSWYILIHSTASALCNTPQPPGHFVSQQMPRGHWIWETERPVREKNGWKRVINLVGVPNYTYIILSLYLLVNSFEIKNEIWLQILQSAGCLEGLMLPSFWVQNILQNLQHFVDNDAAANPLPNLHQQLTFSGNQQ